MLPMKTLTTLLNEYGIRRMARQLDVEASSVSRWAKDNAVPRWWLDKVRSVLGVKRFEMARKRT
jgi:hypothetical protein